MGKGSSALSRRLRRIRVTPAQRRHGRVGPSSLWKMKRAFQIGFLKEHGLQPGHRVLDIGCGTLRGGIPLIGFLEPGNYTGIDVRDEVIREGLKEVVTARLTERNPRVETVPDLSAADLGCDYHVIWSFQVLIHMSDQILDGAVRFIARHLAPGGQGFVTVKVGPPRERSWREFPTVTRPLAFYVERFGAAGLTVSDLGPLTALGHTRPDRTVEEQSDQRMLAIERDGCECSAVIRPPERPGDSKPRDP